MVYFHGRSMTARMSSGS